MRRIFKNKKERDEYYKKEFVTTGKLIEWLKQFPDDTLMYSMESNTHTYQHIPSLKDFIGSIKEEKKRLYDIYEHWHSGNKQKAKDEVKDIFQYVSDKKNAVCISM